MECELVGLERKQFSSAGCLHAFSATGQSLNNKTNLPLSYLLLAFCFQGAKTRSEQYLFHHDHHGRRQLLVHLLSIWIHSRDQAYYASTLTLNSCSLSHFYKVQNTTTTSVFVTYLPCRRTHTSVRENTSSPFFCSTEKLSSVKLCKYFFAKMVAIIAEG